MNVLIASILFVLSFNVFANEECMTEKIELKVNDIQDVLIFGKKVYLCDFLDLISGNYVLGAGNSEIKTPKS